VFISYARESNEHDERVAGLARRLREEGVDAWIDQFVEDDPPYWPTWMQDQVEQADFVLCVMSKAYKYRFESRERIMPGRGVNWEGLVVTEATYADLPAAHRKFIAIAFDAADLANVPRVLLGAGRTAYVLYDYYHQLYRRLTGQRRPVPSLGEVQATESTGATAQAIQVHSRPPFVPLRFLDRTRETGLLREAVQDANEGCVLITGRAGIGKTALVSRMLQDLESWSGCNQLEFAYISTGSSIPVSPDLIRTHLRTDARVGAGGSTAAAADVRTVLVLDQAELLLDAHDEWKSARLGAYLAELATRPSFHLIIVSQRAPSAAVLATLPHTRIAMTNGLPPEDVEQMLLNADRECQLGLADAPAAVESFLRQANGNPRAAELIVAALVADPMLDPQHLARDLIAVPDVAAQLLGDSYNTLGEPEREVVAILAVAGSTMPIEVLREAVADASMLEECLRKLAGREIVKYDRNNRRVRLDPFDAQYATRQLVSPEMTVTMHRRIAGAGAQVIDCGGLSSAEADTWAIAIVEHFMAAGEMEDGAAVLNRFQARFLESHGVYDQLVRLRERLMADPVEVPSNRVLLVRLLSLQGDFEGARRVVQSSDTFVLEARDRQLLAQWDVEVGGVERDSGDGDAALRRFCRAFEEDVAPRIRACALTAAAQIARRRADLDQARVWLGQAVELISGITTRVYCDGQTEALALHQLAMIARFRQRPAEALGLLTQSVIVSEAIEDRGGLAYRQCFRAALDSDNFELDDATRALQMALATYEQIGDRWGAAAATAALASIEADRGSYDQALTHAGVAANLARETGNMRVLGVLPAVQLHVERRTGSLRLGTRGLVVRAQRFLTAKGYQLYAARLDIDLLLHDFATGAIDLNAANEGIPVGLRVVERLPADEDLVDTVLTLCRPLAVFAPIIGQLPSGIAADVALVTRAE
jgi:tetratricopeptide (TPR) repeat protein